MRTRLQKAAIRVPVGVLMALAIVACERPGSGGVR
jgi:hypothetical protein